MINKYAIKNEDIVDCLVTSHFFAMKMIILNLLTRQIKLEPSNSKTCKMWTMSSRKSQIAINI